MEFRRFVWLVLLVCFSLCLSSTQGYRFYVGGRNGWVLNPYENYSHWAERNRFQVNDTLYFKYKNGSDSVLVVNKDDFYKCNTKNSIQKLDGGDSEFTFDRSGPFYFISGQNGNCDKGQKLFVIVLAVRQPCPPPITPSPSATTPTSPSPSSSPHTHPTHSPPLPPPVGPTPPGTVPSPPPGGSADSTAPAPAKNGASHSVTSPSSVLVSWVVVLASVVLMSSLVQGGAFC